MNNEANTIIWEIEKTGPVKNSVEIEDMIISEAINNGAAICYSGNSITVKKMNPTWEDLRAVSEALVLISGDEKRNNIIRLFVEEGGKEITVWTRAA